MAVVTGGVGFVRALLTLIGLHAVIYFGLTAYLGYSVGSAIAAAERKELVRTGAHIVGRELMERYAVRRSGLPEILVDSPTFWLLLRNSE